MEVIQAPASEEEPFKQPLSLSYKSIHMKSKGKTNSFAGLLADIFYKFAVGRITIWAQQQNGKFAQTQTF